MGQAQLCPRSETGSGLRLLVAEDNSLISRALLAQLTEQGHRVTLARDGEEAVLACAEETFDVVLMDCQMPSLDGFAATRVIRCLDGYSEIPIVALTTESFEGVREKCRQVGMSGFLIKPATACQLRVCLEHHARAGAGPAHLLRQSEG